KTPGKLHDGGRLQAMSLQDDSGGETRNWGQTTISPAQPRPVTWIDLDDIESPRDDLRFRGFRAGAARFARGEGIWYGDKEVYFACTSGGRARVGQIWRYRPSVYEGTQRESKAPGELELFVEPNDTRLLNNADNLTVAPWGDVVVCEDQKRSVVRLVGINPAGGIYTLAHSRMRTEFTGVTFSPDGTTLFVNAQGKGLTIAITGPWKQSIA
ncbi:MAG: alkaline phosphatase PhoX, partial [Planctomycetota bacterium]|nr:alkaline phosphatase PhoX [Planctomycetota bacterium]